MVKLYTFGDAFAYAGEKAKKHLILGNGFSISLRPKIFHYGSIYEQADFTDFDYLEKSFEALETEDFEEVINALENGSKLIAVYSPEADIAEAMYDDAQKLKNILVDTIASTHPDRPSDITDEEYWSCQSFLQKFISTDSRGQNVFSLNYDLLLYWTLMHTTERDDDPKIALQKNDSFGNDEDNPDTDYVVWNGETSSKYANIHFLHGAVHLFDAGAELQKYTWVRSGIPLIDQARAAIGDNKFPLFVAEGESDKKKEKIRHNAYLYQALKKLTAQLETPSHCVFIFGHSLAENDDHILNRIGRGKCSKLFVSIYGDPNSDVNKEIIRRAVGLSEMRRSRYPLEVCFYDAESAHIWDN
jgi:hypothetical protein